MRRMSVCTAACSARGSMADGKADAEEEEEEEEEEEVVAGSDSAGAGERGVCMPV